MIRPTALPRQRHGGTRGAGTRFLAHLSRCVTFLALLGPSVSAIAAPTWVATWGASPVAPSEIPTNPGFTDQTVRMTIRTSVGGDAVRVRLSNAFGTTPLTIGDVHVGIAAGEADIVPDSDRQLKFGGAAAVVIPPGGTVTSDPAPLTVARLSNLSVSLFLPGPTERATFHHICLCQSHVAAHDVAGQVRFPAGTAVPHWFYLTGVEVRPTEPSETIVAFGDSLTDGFRSIADGAYPGELAKRLAAAGAHVGVVNAGLSGNGLLHDFGTPTALSRFDQDVLRQAGAKYVIVLLGINDIGLGRDPATPASAADITNGYRQLIERAHAYGLKVFGGTLLPMGGSFHDTPNTQALRDAVNRFIRTSGAFDGVIDFDGALRDPAQPLRLASAYDSDDHLHPNAAGYRRMAEAVDLSLFNAGRTPDANDDAARAK